MPWRQGRWWRGRNGRYRGERRQLRLEGPERARGDGMQSAGSEVSLGQEESLEGRRKKYGCGERAYRFLCGRFLPDGFSLFFFFL